MSTKSNFDNLLDELDALQKAQTVSDDQKIEDAANPEEDDQDQDRADNPSESQQDADNDPDQGEAEDEVMGKSFKVVVDGQEVDAVDGTELVKSFARRLDGQEERMEKALGMAVDLIKSQGVQIKSLEDRVAKLANEGRGRKTVVTVLEKPALMQKSEEAAGIRPAEFMLKALSAQKSGRVTGHEVAVAESHLNRGQPVPEHITRKVLEG